MRSGLLSRRNVARAMALGAGAAAAAGWTVQHRLAARAVADTDDIAREGLTLPDDVVHHDIEVDDGGRIHVVERGRGPAIVFLHGIMLRSDLWAHALRDLAPHHRVIAVDLRGHGKSVPGRAGFSAPGATGPVETLAGVAPMAAAGEGSPGIRRLASDVKAVLEALEVDHAVVVGHSMGGLVALQLVSDLGPSELHRRVAGLVLVSTFAGPFSSLPGVAGVARMASPLSARAVLVAERLGTRPAVAGLRLLGEPHGFRRRRPARAGPIRRVDAQGHKGGHHRRSSAVLGGVQPVGRAARHRRPGPRHRGHP